MQTGKGLLLKADPIAAAFRDEVKASLSHASRRPRLVGILATSSAPSKFYADFTKKQCEDLGVEFILKKTGAADTGDLGEGEGVEEAIIEANEDENVDGIMVCMPSWNPTAHFPYRPTFYWSWDYVFLFFNLKTLDEDLLPSSLEDLASDRCLCPGFLACRLLILAA
jgi:hypothetical protein